MATTVAASKAVCMKSYSNIARADFVRGVLIRPFVIMLVCVALHVVAAGHDKYSVLQPHDPDFGSVDTCYNRARDRVIDRAEGSMAASEVKDAVKNTEQWVQLMGTKQHRDPEFALKPLCPRC